MTLIKNYIFFIFCVSASFDLILGQSSTPRQSTVYWLFLNGSRTVPPFTTLRHPLTTTVASETANVTQTEKSSPNDTTSRLPSLTSFRPFLNGTKTDSLIEEYNSTDWPTLIEENLPIDDNMTLYLWNANFTSKNNSFVTLTPIYTDAMEDAQTQNQNLNFTFNFTKIPEMNEQALGQRQLNETFPNYLNETFDLAAMSLEKISALPLQFWVTIKEDMLHTLTFNQTVTILDKIESTGDIQTWNRMIDILKDKLSVEFIMSQLKNHGFPSAYKMDKRLALNVIERLGDPSNWNETIVESIGPSILQFQLFFLTKIKNKAALFTIFNYLAEYLERTEDRPESLIQTFAVFAMRLTENLFGPISSWNHINQTLATLIPLIPPLNIKQIKPTCVHNSTETIASMNFFDRFHGQPFIEIILKYTNFSSLNSEMTLKLMQNLGNLIKHLRIQDISSIPKNTFNDQVIRQMCSGNNSNIDKELGKWLLSISKPRDDEWSAVDVLRLKPLFRFANSNTLSELVTKNLLDGPTVMEILESPNLDKPQLRALETVVRATFNVQGEWNLDYAPANVLSIITSKDFKKMNTSTIARNTDKFNKIVKNMSPTQIIAIAQKIAKLNFQELADTNPIPHNLYLSLLVIEETDNEENLKKILLNMPTDSPQVQNYIRLKWNTVASNLSTEDFRNDFILLKSLTCEMLENLNDDQIVKLVKIINDANCPIQVKTTICIVEKLKRYLFEKSPVANYQGDEDGRLLAMLNLEDLNTIGGQHLLQFSAISLQEQTPRSRCEFIFALIGQVPLKIFNLLQPPEKKRQIARAALSCMNKLETPLTDIDAFNIGNLMGYMPETVLANMETNAFVVSLPYINGKLSSIDDLSCNIPDETSDIRPPPCLTTAARSTLRYKLNSVFGSPEKWGETELRSIGCLLSTLYPEQLNQVSDRAILSVSDELIKCWDHETTSAENVYVTVCQKELPLSATTMMVESSKQLKRRLAKAALQNTEIQQRVKRNSDKMKGHLTCEMIRMLGPAVVEITDEELGRLLPGEITDCLEDLGRHPMSNNKAIILWSKLKNALKQPAANIGISTYDSMGYIAQGLNVTELFSLPLRDPSQISVFGATHRNFSTEQLQTLASLVLVNYQPNSSLWTTDDMINFGYILCGFNTSDVDQIIPDVYINISYLLKDVIGTCPIKTREAFARKAVFYYGPVANWTSAVITNIGPALGGVPPKELAQIPGHSFQSVAAEWVKTLPIESVKALHREQIGNLSVEAVSNFSPEQLNQLSVSEIEVVNQMKGIPSSATLRLFNGSIMLACLLVSWSLVN